MVRRGCLDVSNLKREPACWVLTGPGDVHAWCGGRWLDHRWASRGLAERVAARPLSCRRELPLIRDFAGFAADRCERHPGYVRQECDYDPSPGCFHQGSLPGGEEGGIGVAAADC
jgi:hypothetical protein